MHCDCCQAALSILVYQFPAYVHGPHDTENVLLKTKNK